MNYIHIYKYYFLSLMCKLALQENDLAMKHVSEKNEIFILLDKNRHSLRIY